MNLTSLCTFLSILPIYFGLSLLASASTVDEQVHFYLAKRQWDNIRKIGSPAIPALLDASVNFEDDDDRLMAAKTLTQLQYVPQSLEAAINLYLALRDPDAIATIGSSAVLPLINTLNTLTKDTHGRDRSTAVKALGKLRDPRSLEPLLSALKDRYYSNGCRRYYNVQCYYPVVSAAIDALVDLGDDRAIEPLVGHIATARSYNGNRGEVFHVAKRLVDFREKAVKPLMQILGYKFIIESNDTTGHIREAVAVALGMIADKRAIEPLSKLLNDTDQEVIREAASALGRMKDDRAVEPLSTLLNHKNQDIRYAVVNALAEIGSERVTRLLIAALRDTDRRVREKAAEALEKRGWRP